MQLIPEDIISYIVGYIGTDEQTLRACNLTSRVFRPSCKKYLFASIAVALNPGSRYEARHKRLHEVLTSGPDVGGYVKQLNLTLTNREVDSYGIAVLSQFPRLRRLVILSGEVAMIRWLKLPEKLQDSISSLFLLPTLESLTLSYIADFPTSALCGATSLRALDLDSITVLSSEEEPSSGPQITDTTLSSVGKLETFRLTTLSTDDLETILTQLLGVQAGTDPVLRNLELQTSTMLQSSLSSVQDVLNAFSRNLRSLVVTAGDDEHLNLSAFSELEHLSIIFPEYSEEALPWLCSTLQTLPLDNKVSSIGFTFWPYETFIIDPDWCDLDSELSTNDKYHCGIRIRLSGLKHDFRYFLKELAPRIASRKNVEIFNGSHLVDWRPTNADIQTVEVPTYFDDSERDDEE